jgi:hypothetical protein
MPKWKTVRNGMRYNESRQQNPPLQNAKSATVQMQNDYQNYRHRQFKPAARRLQTTMHWLECVTKWHRNQITKAMMIDPKAVQANRKNE